jgi:hypothetical protein
MNVYVWRMNAYKHTSIQAGGEQEKGEGQCWGAEG